MKGQSFVKRLGFALHGLRLAVARERSLRTHLLAAAALLAVLLATRPAPLWWAILALAAGLVLVAELFNSALETLLDHLHPGRHPAIGAAKDIAAGAVLMACAVAVLAGAAFLLHWLTA
ncbi:diacylglycerol kinase [Azotobacter beijerinckii]|uniref:Diacylglycerol kinase (ATP) n=1 Tax=Azotobacter beijerinckii TaxID=170623 RepID=A0A1H6XMM8_9GAMM|nr:diacylglycerol kinase [Azotobacter beijerinckii]MDV7213616.1 diacylglycerol kinase [Azotobacter beijerinckii]SEJ30329.1 diacylglycerol kinase (ATP) [Azotobacter beijerinckii]SER17131.1 diacylglycerol kinase (ATP) [Azotobacter beijerinckii]SFB64028.1 diacylglycerol kinase (ATP) [Azotobacter beijerinckii]SFL44852.1 diacylglycerol kinase (ATP) [Azotobacter beijerinckii]